MPLCPVVEAGTPVYGNDEVERNLALVETVAHHRGLSPEAVAVMLEFAMSLRMGKLTTNPSPLVFLLVLKVSATYERNQQQWDTKPAWTDLRSK